MVNRIPAPPMPIEGFPDAATDRLKKLDGIVAEMERPELAAAITWLATKYFKKWPTINPPPPTDTGGMAQKSI